MNTHPMNPRSNRLLRALRALLAVAAMSIAVVAITPTSALAQTTLRISESEGSGARHIDLGLGKSLIVELPRDAKEVFVASPGVANAVVRGTRKVFVIATGVGQTSLFFMDGAGAQIAAIDINVQRDTSPIKAAIDAALPGTMIEVRQLNDGIMLMGTAASSEEAAQAVVIAAKFVGNKVESVANSITIRGRDQVMLKITVAEVQRQVLKQLGVDLTTGTSFVQLASTSSFPVNGDLASASADFGNGSTQATLKAFERTGVIRTLAEPTLTAISGESAKFLAGGEIPILSASTVNSSGFRDNTFTYKPVGVSLSFSPTVLNEGRISMHISTEVTDIDTQGSGALPSFKVRRAETTVEMPSGGTLAMAGMIQQSTRQAINGTPGLMNLPILGTLFRSRDYIRSETELMILVTPYIAKTVDRKDLSLPTDGFADATDPSAWLLGRVNRIYGVKGGTPRAGGSTGRYGFIID